MRGARVAGKLRAAKEKDAKALKKRQQIKENKKHEGEGSDGDDSDTVPDIDSDLESYKGYGKDVILLIENDRVAELAKKNEPIVVIEDPSGFDLV